MLRLVINELKFSKAATFGNKRRCPQEISISKRLVRQTNRGGQLAGIFEDTAQFNLRTGLMACTYWCCRYPTAKTD